MSTFDFGSAEPWKGSAILGKGRHLVSIDSAKPGTSSGGHPQLELQFSNSDGELRDWPVYTPTSVGKIVALTDAAGLERPKPGEEYDPDTGELFEVYVNRLVGRKVVVWVVEEPSQKDPTKMRSVVNGYSAAPGAPGSSDVTAANEGADFVPSGAPSAGDDDIPF